MAPPLRSFMRAAIVALATLSCSSNVTTSGPETPPAATLLSGAITTVTVEVDYQPGAAPYVGKAGRFDDVWQIARDNVTRMFAGSTKTIHVPSALADLEVLGDVTAHTFTSDAILEIATRHRDARADATTATFYIVLLDGYFEDEAGPQEDVLGVSIGRTGVIALFKPVIAGAEGGAEGLARFVEQTTLVHELGHAIGLVDDGVSPVNASHHDAAHAHHCTNERCAMNWSNEGLRSAIVFARQLSLTGSTVLLDANCLADLDAAATR